MSADLAELDDWRFRETWGSMTLAERAALPAGERKHYIERYRELTAWMDLSTAQLDRIEAHVAAPDPEPAPSTVRENLIDWTVLTGEPPAFPWILDHWLSWHPTLLAGRGGIGKSLLVQQLGTALACGMSTWCAKRDPLRVLYWACEDDLEQLWRRQHAICLQLKIGFDRLENLTVDARYGLENTLMTSEYGRPMWTPRIEFLRQQVNDLHIDVLALDNLGHTFGANENVRHDVTMFLGGIAGLVTGRQFCPILLGHPSKSINSEYSGSTAWENAVRMRWYLDDKLPDQKPDLDTPPDPDYRVLAKRKTNYTRLDYVQFRFDQGVLIPEDAQSGEPGVMKGLREQRAKTVVLNAIEFLAAKGIYGNNQFGRHYLPKVILENKASEGYTKAELSEALRALIFDQKLEETIIGKNAAGKRIIGLKARIT